jgi:hypothetical protein
MVSAMDHRQLDRRSLELAWEIARRLLANPALIQVARDNLSRWQARPDVGTALRQCYLEWAALLDRLTIPELVDLLQRDDEDAARLRQNTPFTGILTPEEVWQIKRNFKPETAHAT